LASYRIGFFRRAGAGHGSTLSAVAACHRHPVVISGIAGDVAQLLWLQRWGGLLNVAAILLFLANNVRAVRSGTQVHSIRKR